MLFAAFKLIAISIVGDSAISDFNRHDINDAPTACFADNADPNPDRRAIRNTAMTRLRQKLDALHPAPGVAPPPVVTVSSLPPPIPGLPPSSPPPSSMANGPGPNMPELPQTGTVDVPVVGPDHPGNQDSNAASVLDPISPDRIPIAGNAGVPGHQLGPGEPLDKLQRLLDNSNAYGESRE